MANSKIWKECEECGNKTKATWRNKNKYLCYKCYSKNFKFPLNKPKSFTLEKALSKEYIVRGYYSKASKSIIAKIHVPPVLAGYKVKLSLIKK